MKKRSVRRRLRGCAWCQEVGLHPAKNGVILVVVSCVHLTGVHPAAGLDHELLLLAAQDTNPNDFGRPERDFPPAFSAAADVAVVAGVPDAVGEFCAQAYLTSRVQLNPGLLLHRCFVANLAFEFEYFVLLLPEMRTN